MAGWPSSARYALVLARSRAPLAVRASSFSGTRAAVLGWCLAASSSSSAREGGGPWGRGRWGGGERLGAEGRVEEAVDQGADVLLGAGHLEVAHVRAGPAGAEPAGRGHHGGRAAGGRDPQLAGAEQGQRGGEERGAV